MTEVDPRALALFVMFVRLTPHLPDDSPVFLNLFNAYIKDHAADPSAYSPVQS